MSFLWAPVWVYVGVLAGGALVGAWLAVRDYWRGNHSAAAGVAGVALINAVLAVVIATGGW